MINRNLDPKPWVLRKPDETNKVCDLYTFEVIGLLEACPELIDHITWEPEASFFFDHKKYEYVKLYTTPRDFLLGVLDGLAEYIEMYKKWGLLEEPHEDNLDSEPDTQYNPFTVCIENMTVNIYN